MTVLTDFAGQNWLITPAALAVGENPPASIYDQQFLLVLSGVVVANLEGNSASQWLSETVSFLPDMAGPQNSGPLNWAINRFAIPRPSGSFSVGFSLEEWAPFASLSSIFDQDQSINAGFTVGAWRPTHFATGINALTNLPVGNIFAGIDVDLAIRDTDAWIYRLGYNITLLGKIVFLTIPTILFQSNFDPTADQQQPAAQQAVGTAIVQQSCADDLSGADPSKCGSVLVVDPPFPHTNKWMQISRPGASPVQASFLGQLTEAPGDGVYSFSAAIVIPTAASPPPLGNENAVLSISFETISTPFLHLDFMSDNSVRIDDNTVFGSFQRDQVFSVQVTLNISAAQSTANVLLSAGASGNLNYTLSGVNQSLSHLLGAVRVWQGFMDFGISYTTDIVVALES
ncbi:MAG: hypothetical protein WAN65_30965 [Candidatus Sulfotelmatobacter sp.]